MSDPVAKSGATAAIVIGAGLMGRHHARAALAAGASIVGVVDNDLKAAKSLARRVGGVAADTHLNEVLRSGGAAVAHICTPAGSHLEVAKEVAEAGLHALIEKPLGDTGKEARLIHEQFERAGKLACPTHQYALQRSVRTASLELPRLGDPKSIVFDICSAGAETGRFGPDELIAEILPHPLSILQKLQPSIDVAKLEWRCFRSAAGEWSAIASWQGALITMLLSAAGRPTRFMTRITGEKGSIEIDHFHDFKVVLAGAVSRPQKILAPFARSSREFTAATANLLSRAARREFAYPGLNKLVDEFYAASCDSRVAPPITPRESIAVAEARDTIIELANHG